MKNLLSKMFVGAGIMALSAFPSKESVGQEKIFSEGNSLVDSQYKKMEIDYSFKDSDGDGSPEELNASLDYDGRKMVRFSAHDRKDDGEFDSVYINNRFKKLISDKGKISYFGLLENPIVSEEAFEYQDNDTLCFYRAYLIAKSRRRHRASFSNEPVASYGEDFEKRFDRLTNSFESEDKLKEFLFSEFYNNAQVFEGKYSDFNAGVYSEKVLQGRHLPIKD